LINRGAIKQPKIVKRKMESGRMGQDYLFDGENGSKDAITVMYRLAPKYVGKLKEILEGAERPEPLPSKPKPALALVPQVAPPITKLLDGQASMTSQEITDLVGSRHDSVVRTIERLSERGVVQPPPMVEVKNSGGQTVRHFIFRGEQGKRDSIIVVAQLSPEFTAVLVDRWQELEAQVAKPAFKVPTTLHGALLLAANLEEQRQALTQQVEVQERKIAEDTPKVTFFDITADTKDLQSAATVAGTINTDRSTTLLQVARPWNCTTRRSGKSGSIYKRSYRHFTED
jgi:phage regulator Rha-like protein